MNTPWFERGVDQGRREVLRELLEDRFGPLSPSVRERLQQWPADRLPELRRAVVTAQSLRDLGLEE